MKKLLYSAVTAAVLAAGIFLSRPAPSQSPGPAGPPPVTIFVVMGDKARAVDKWDGAAHVSGGNLLGAKGWHFSAGDSVTPAGAWKCVTRRDDVPPYADIHYTEMRPGDKPETRYHPVGVFLTLQPTGSARVSIETAQGNFDFALDNIGSEPVPFLDGRASAARVPWVEKLSTPQYEDDEPSIAALPDGRVAVAWIAYRDRADRLFLRTRTNSGWSSPEEVSPKPADLFRCALAADAGGTLWAFWSQREGDRWQIWSRRKKGTTWQTPERIANEGSNTFLRAAASPAGQVYVVWQSYRNGQSDIYLRAFNGAWSDEMRVSESPANDWEPDVAAAPDGSAYVVWDSYDKGNYDVFLRAWRNGQLDPIRPVTSSPKFQAHATVAVDAQARPWVAWDESGVNWAKDQGFLIPTPLATPIHQQRAVALALWDGAAWIQPRRKPVEVFPEPMRQNAEHPHIAFDGGGSLQLIFRHWTRRNDRSIGSPIVWENYLTRFDGNAWSSPEPLPSSGGSIEKNPALARDISGDLWAVWMTDARPFATMVPGNADVYCARLGKSSAPPNYGNAAFDPFSEPFVEAIPIHNRETADVKAVRAYTIAHSGKNYKIYRGDMHRHTDVSQDFKYDGSLLELYRYGLDSASFDYIVSTDHQAGYDQEFTWWQNQKLVDLFQVAGAFTPLYGYERSLPYPNGHRNVVFPHRGVRTLPLGTKELTGEEGAAKLYQYLKQNGGIAMPHSTATDQGTDWRDNDPDVEPLVEIYQGYRNSYEYEGAPKSATALNPQAQKSGWQPAGFWWNALAKGYKHGVQSSSDHWSTHISYACLIADSFTREGLFDAIRKRHAYGATDNIILDVRAKTAGGSYLMGDSFASGKAPLITVHAAGTAPIKQVDIIKNQKFAYTSRPDTKETTFEFNDRDFGPGESSYYVRILQEDGQLAWSSPMWVKK